jgi:hypothetical protein
VKSAYDALRKAKHEQIAENGPIARRLLAIDDSVEAAGGEGRRVGRREGAEFTGGKWGGRSESQDKWAQIDALMAEVEALVGGGRRGREGLGRGVWGSRVEGTGGFVAGDGVGDEVGLASGGR